MEDSLCFTESVPEECPKVPFVYIVVSSLRISNRIKEIRKTGSICILAEAPQELERLKLNCST